MSELGPLSSPSDLSISDFTYELPEHRIAKYPLEQRDESKLLKYDAGKLEEYSFYQLDEFLQPEDCLVFNDTKVIHARLHFQRDTGAQIEVLCLEPLNPVEVNQSFATTTGCEWKAMVGNAKRWKRGEQLSRKIEVDQKQCTVWAEMIEKQTDAYAIRFSWDLPITFAEILMHMGILPLPPYLNRDTEAEDEERYQTVYAQADGSVAAPTAGLHFTQRVFDRLRQRQVNSLFVTLHVGAGTFKPVKSETMSGHEMHQERVEVSRHAISQMLASTKTKRIIAVGTTSLRTIESVYWFGVKLISRESTSSLLVSQWEPYQLANQSVSAEEALQAVIDWMEKNHLSYLSGSTQLLIAPGYRIRIANALITNFHQPESTLLLLVSAFIGDNWKKVYDYALQNDFRFLSFGDSSILFRD